MSSDVTIHTLTSPFVTEGGFTFHNPEIAYKTWGTLNEKKDNVVVVFHALTGNAEADDWFGGLFDADGILDPTSQFIVCMNVIGSCYGSTGPWSADPETGKPWRGDFPELTIRDLVRFQQMLLNEWGITEIRFVIGGSMGGMQALEFAIMDERVQRAIPIAIGKNHSPWAIGISHVQRQAIYNDPKWQNGYYTKGNGPDTGMAVARMMAMVSYRSPRDFEQKFGRKPQPEKPDLFQIESYLNYQGKKLVDRFDALTYVRLTKAMDRFDVARGRGTYQKVLEELNKPVLLIGISSDQLYPTAEQRELADLLPHGEYAEMDSPHGHDAFLIDFDQLNKIIHPFLNRTEELQNVSDKHA